MSKNVAVFVDVANIFYAAKAAGVDIDYVTLLKASSAGRDLVRAYAYTGLDPENENQRNFHDFLRRHGYKVVSKDIRKYGDGKVKANLDIELVVDMMKTARNLDIAIVVSGDGDFAPAIRAVQEMGVRVEVVSFRGNTSSDLIDVADIFTDITQIAKVEKGSSRSGRRVATDEEDLSMTEVPDKMTEGTGDGRRRGRGGRRASATGEAATTRAASSRTRSSSSRSAAARDAAVVEGSPLALPGEKLVALPGEKLARAARPARAAAATESDEELSGETAELPAVQGAGADELEVAAAEAGAILGEADGALDGEGHRRRRRRRGGRGRGRGSAAREGLATDGAVAAEGADLEEFEEAEPLPTPRRQASSFGSVWDSQLGKAPSAAGVGAGPLPDDEDLEEPSIPEYLLAERRREAAGSRRPGRGGGPSRRGGAYAAALERERFGGGRGSAPVSRFADPMQRRADPGRGDGGRRSGGRPFERSEPRSSSGEPWSEVPPEIEAMLRAQLAGSARADRPAPQRSSGPRAQAAAAPESARRAVAASDQDSIQAAASASATEGSAEAVPAARGTRTGRAPASRRGAASKAATGGAAEGADLGEGSASAGSSAGAAPRRRSAKSAGGTTTAGSGEMSEVEAAAAPKRVRRSRSTAGSSAAPTAAGTDAVPGPKPRTTRRKTAAG